MIYHCFFEQSGTFKNEFKKLGYKAYDYDILNDFNQTDYIMDLYDEIEKAYLGIKSVFDTLEGGEHMILAFFPCVRFEAQVLINFRGENAGFKDWSIKEKLGYDLKLHDELNKNYQLITKLVLVCMNKNIPLVIENPYSEQHYLRRYWCIKPTIIDMNRRENGDYYVKPTQYFFIGCEPKYNFIFEPIELPKQLKVSEESTVTRSMISPQYANRFIREYILEENKNE